MKWKTTACWSCRTNRWRTRTASKCRKAIIELLHVLANDFASSTGVLAITGVTQPARGNVRISTDRQTLLYSPDRGCQPTAETFTYTISDGTGATSTATVTVFVRAKVLTPIAVDDTYRVVAGSGAQELHVLVNDPTRIRFVKRTDR